MEKFETTKKTENTNANKRQWKVYEEYENLKKNPDTLLSDEKPQTQNETDPFCPLLPNKKYGKISASTNNLFSDKMFIFEKETNTLAAAYRVKKENDALYETREFFNIPNESYGGFTNITIKYLMEENKQNNTLSLKPIDLTVTDAVNPERIIKYRKLTDQNFIAEQEIFDSKNIITFEKIKKENKNNSDQENAKKDYQNFQNSGTINAKTEKYLFGEPYRMEIWEKTDNSGKKQYKAFIKENDSILGTIDYITNENGVENRFFETIFNVFDPTIDKYKNIKIECAINENNEEEEISATGTDPKTNEILSFFDNKKINETEKENPINKFIIEESKTLEDIFRDIKNIKNEKNK